MERIVHSENAFETIICPTHFLLSGFHLLRSEEQPPVSMTSSPDSLQAHNQQSQKLWTKKSATLNKISPSSLKLLTSSI